MKPNITNNFNAPIGQYIAHVDKIEAHFDKDMTMHIAELESTPQPDQQIKIAEYFKGPFRGFGGGTDYLAQLSAELKNDYSETDYCCIAVLIYNSHVLNLRRPNTFKEWYRVFTQGFQLPCSNPNRNPRHFKPDDHLRNNFPYIE